MLSKFASLWRNIRHSNKVERDLHDEVQATLDLLTDEKILAGATPANARRAAAIELGSTESIKDQVREMRAGARIDTTIRDIRYAARVLARNPLFTLTASLSLAIGIGATTAVVTIANGLLLRSAVGVADSGRVVDVVVSESDGPGVTPISYPDYLQLRRLATTLEGVYAYELELVPASLRVADDGAERVFATTATTNFFSVLGVGVAAGRTFAPSDDEQPGAASIAVLSHHFWMNRFNGDRGVIGQTVRLNGERIAIVGVAAEGFRGIGVLAPDLWVPTAIASVIHPDRARSLLSGPHRWLMVGARLRPGVTRAAASSEIGALGPALPRDPAPPATVGPLLPQEKPTSPAAFKWSVEIASPIPYGLRLVAAGFLGLLTLLVSVVLVIACANVAGVLLARASARRHEIAVRVALGAGRARVIRQLVTETLLLFALAGAAGLLLARGITTLLVSLLPAFPLPVSLSVPLDGRVVAFSLTLTGLAAILCGLAPALHASKADVVSALKDASQSVSDRMRLRNAFVVAQVAFSMLLVVTAGLLVRAFDRVSAVDRGFDARNVDTASLDLAMAGYTEATGPAFRRELLGRVRALTTVSAATFADHAPGPGGHTLGLLSVPGFTPSNDSPSERSGVRSRSTNSEQQFVSMNWTLVEPGYFATLRIPLVAGRDFSDADREGTLPVAIVGEAAARRFWPERDPVGQYLLWHSADPNAPPTRIVVVGVAGDLKFGRPGSAARLELYRPLSQHYWRVVTLLARSSNDQSNASTLRSVVSTMEPNLPLLGAQTLESQQSGPVDTQLRLAASVAGSVGLIGVLLAGIGTYGVTAYALTRRTREIAIRLSLGAPTGNVVALVLRQGMTLVVIGAAIGLGLGLGVGRLLSGARFGVTVVDPLVFAGATAILIAIGFIACFVPVLRASQINPMVALRYE